MQDGPRILVAAALGKIIDTIEQETGARPSLGQIASVIVRAHLDSLKEAQAAVDRRLLKIVEALDSAELQRIVSVHRGTSIQRERMDRLLLHLFQHQVHHRGQAHSMLCGTSVSPPQLDEFWATEFTELGWSEEKIWGGPEA